MDSNRHSGQAPFVFTYREDLHNLPKAVLASEKKLHGGFAIDKRTGYGDIYYGMPDCGLIKISPDLGVQELIELPPTLLGVNLHSTKIGDFDGETRLFVPVNDAEMVAIVTLAGEINLVLPRPELDEYGREDTIFRPTDTVLFRDTLYVADGYGANYIVTATPSADSWTGLFGGKTEDKEEHGKFGTAHGMNPAPSGDRLVIADRPHSRLELYTLGGRFSESYSLPAGSRPCGIDYAKFDGGWWAVVGNLDDPQEGRPAPIYILDAKTYEIVSMIRPKEELGVDLADHIHNVIWYEYGQEVFLICQAWNPGYYFVLQQVQ